METVELLTARLLALVKYAQWSQNDAANLFIALMGQFKNMTEDTLIKQIAKTLYQVEIHKIKKSDLVSEMEPGQFIENIEDTINNIVSKKEKKTLEEILGEIKAQKDIDENMLDDVKDIVSSVSCWNISAPFEINGPSRLNELKKSLFKLCKAVQNANAKKWEPNLTQMVSWCILVLSKSSQLIQVGTGEGKSCIVAMFAAYRASTRQCVDIICSSPVLAERDAREWSPFFQLLNITVDVNTNKEQKDLRKCYESQVVYGTTESFARDWLLQNFHKINVRPERKFQCAIVDEVDSLMLDKGLEVVYLSTEMPVMQTLNVILAEIWFVVSKFEHLDTGETLGPVQPFSQILSENLECDMNFGEYSFLQVGEDSDGSVDDVSMFTLFQEIFPQYRLKLYHKENGGTLQELMNSSHTGATNRQELSILVLGSGLCRLLFWDKETLHKSVKKKIKLDLIYRLQMGKTESIIPGFLQHINGKLHTWIENAFLAKTMKLGHEYILHEGSVVPVDYHSTGVVQNNMKWEDGLQQFLEMKHQTRLTNMNIITNFRSNVSLFQSYKNQIYGLTGTLGNKKELDTLKGLYSNIKSCKIPSFTLSKLHEEDGIFITEEREWVQQICAVVKEQVSPTVFRGPRAALVICETINRAEIIYSSLANIIPVEHLKMYTNNNMNNSAVTDQHVVAGKVIIATNLAGRGTDLKVCPKVNKEGGLFVVQSFLPINTRVEQQAFGRTARQGQPGSAQIIMCSTHFFKPFKLVMAQISPLLSLLGEVMTALHPSTVQNKNNFVDAFKAYHNNSNEKTYETIKCVLKLILSSNETHSPTTLEATKLIRDTMIQIRLASFLETDIPKIVKKEELFLEYLNILDTITKQDLRVSKEIISSLHECWGMWLLMKFNENESKQTLIQELRADLEIAKKTLQSKQSPSSMVYYYVRSGNRFRHNGQFEESIEMYTRATKSQPCCAIIAYYNRALTTLKKRDRGYIVQALADFKKAEELVKAHMKELSLTLDFVQVCNQAPKTENSLLTKQFQIKILLQELLQSNIQEALTKLQLAEDRGKDVQISEKEVIFLLSDVPIAFLLEQMDQLLGEIVNLISLGLDTIISLDTVFSVAGFLTKIFRNTARHDF